MKTVTSSTIRVAGPADAPAVRAIIRRAYAKFERVIPPELYAAYLEDLLVLGGCDGDATVLVAVAGEDVVGCVGLYRDASGTGFGWPADRAVIRALAVDPHARAGGVGRQLVEECIRRATSWRAAAIGLHTAAFMTAAVRLYERRGFTRVPHLDVDPTRSSSGTASGAAGRHGLRAGPSTLRPRAGLGGATGGRRRRGGPPGGRGRGGTTHPW